MCINTDIVSLACLVFHKHNSYNHVNLSQLFLKNLIIFLQLPGKKGSGAGGWMIQAKLQIYLWLGSIKHKKNYPSGLPPGFQPTNELLNAERPGLPPPTMIHYSEKHVSTLMGM